MLAHGATNLVRWNKNLGCTVFLSTYRASTVVVKYEAGLDYRKSELMLSS